MPNSISSIIRKKKVIITSGSVAVGVMILIAACQFYYLPLQRVSHGLSITIRSSQSGSVVLYYDTGMRFQERERLAINIPGDSSWHTFTFPLPDRKIKALRFDPPEFKKAEFEIRGITIIDNWGKTLRRIKPEDVKPLQQIHDFERSDRIIRFQTEETSNDPQLLIATGHSIRFAWDHIRQGTFLLWLPVAGLGTFIVLLLTFHIFRTERPNNLKKISIFFILTVLYLLGVWFLHAKISSCFLEVSIKTTSAETAQLYFDTGHGFSEGQSAVLWVDSIDSFGQYRFPLPQDAVYRLRFDPPSTEGNTIIKKVIVTDGLGRMIRHIPLHQLSPLHQIEKSILQGEHLTITTTQGGADPQIGIHLPNPLYIQKNLFWMDPLFITIMLSVWAMTLLLFKICNKVLDKRVTIEKTLSAPAAALIYECLLIGMVLYLFVVYAKGQWRHTFWFLRHILAS